MERIALIGFGAIGQIVLEHCLSRITPAEVAAIVVRPGSVERAQSLAPTSVAVCTSVAQALSAAPSLFVECAGHGGLQAHAADVLHAGVDLLLASVGALADNELESSLRLAATTSGARILLPPGAVGGMDALGAARIAGLESVEYSSIKSVKSWKGSYAESLIDLDAVQDEQVFFTGTARDAARLFPQNANVAATVALAGIGFERTTVRLTVDPRAAHNMHRVRASGAFGSIDISVAGRTLPANPKSSILAPMSLLRAIESRSLGLRVV